jgi:hypothetical protein
VTGGLAELPPRVGVGLPTDYELLDLDDPRYRWAQRFGVQAAGVFRRGAGTPADPISFIELTVAVVREWSTVDSSTVDSAPSGGEAGRAVPPPDAVPAGSLGWTGSAAGPAGSVGWTEPSGRMGSSGRVGRPGPVGPVGSGVAGASAGLFGWTGSPAPVGPGGPGGSGGLAGSGGSGAPVGALGRAGPVGSIGSAAVSGLPASGGGDWLRPPAYLLVNGLPAAELVLERRLRPPGTSAEIRSWTVEVLVPLAGTGHVVVISGATTDPERQDETEWTTLAVAGTLTYRPGGLPTPAPAVEQPIPELRFADPNRVIAAAAAEDAAPTADPPAIAAATADPATGAPAQPATVPGPPAGPPAGPAPGPPRGTIGQAAVDQLAGLVAGHPSAPRVGTSRTGTSSAGPMAAGLAGSA